MKLKAGSLCNTLRHLDVSANTAVDFPTEELFFDAYDEPVGGGGGVLPSSRLMGMCRWMGLHFQDWIDYHGVITVTN